MVPLRPHTVGLLALLLAGVAEGGARSTSGGDSGDEIALIQHALKSGSQVQPQLDTQAGRAAHGRVPASRSPRQAPAKQQQDRQKMARKIEREAKAKGCPAGFSMVNGDVPGGDQFGRDNRHKLETVELCAQDCRSKPLCKSFEWSPNTHSCIGNKVADGFDKPYQDFMLCVLNGTATSESSRDGAESSTLGSASVGNANAEVPVAAEAGPTAEAAHLIQDAGQAHEARKETVEVVGNETRETHHTLVEEEEAAGAERKAKTEAEGFAKIKADRKAGEEANGNATGEAHAKVQEEADRKGKEDVERRAKVDTEQLEKETGQQVKMKAEAERKAKEDVAAAGADAKQEAMEEIQSKAQAEVEAKPEADRLERDGAELKSKAEADRLAREEEERKAKAEANRLEEEAEKQANTKTEAERKADEEAEAAAKAEADAKARAEAERLEREEAERKSKAEADRLAKEEAERKAKAEADRLEEEAEQQSKMKAEAERKAEDEAEVAAKAEAERKAMEETQRKAQAEADAKARGEAERLEREEAARKSKAEADRLVKKEAERRAKDEAERSRKEEAERKAKEVAEQKAREEAEQKAREEAEQKAREEAEQKAREEAEQKAREEAEQKAREEAEQKAREEAAHKAKVEAEHSANEALCSEGYHWVDGGLLKFDKLVRHSATQATITPCKEACDATEECLSYEWSPTTKLCSLNKEHKPAVLRIKDYLFCQRSQEFLDRLEAKRREAEESAARFKAEKDSASQRARMESDQERAALEALAEHEARNRVEMAERRKQEDAKRRADLEAAREARRLEREQALKRAKEAAEARQKSAEFEKDMIDIEDAAAEDEAEERQKEEQRLAEEEEAKRLAEEAAQREAEARQHAEEAAEAERRRAAEEAEAERRAEEEARQIHEEAERQRAEDEARTKSEEAAKQQELEEAIKRAEVMESEEKAAEDAAQKASEEAKRKAEEEAKQLEELKRQAIEQERLKALEKINPEEAARQRRRAEMKLKMAAALERKRVVMEKLKRKEDEEGQRWKAINDENRRRAQEEMALRRAQEEEERRRREEQEAAERAAEEARRKAEEQATLQAILEAETRRQAEEEKLKAKVMTASRPFAAENPLEDPVHKAAINVRLQDMHGHHLLLKVSKTVRFKVLMNSACARLGVLLSDALFTSGGRQLKPDDNANTFGLSDNDIIKVDDFIKVDDLAGGDHEEEDAAAKAAREFFEAAQREWEGNKSKENVVMLSAAEKAQILERDRAEMEKWQASTRATAKDLPPPRSALEARQKATQVVKQLSEDELAGLIHGSRANQPGFYLANTMNVTLLDIPPLRIQDSTLRFRKYVKNIQKTVIAWPSALALASTWDEGLVGRMAAAVGLELRSKGTNVYLGPSVAVHRSPAAGRNFEQLSGEDPYLGARLVKPYVRGLQSANVMASVRPFGFDHQETNRKYLGVEVSDKVAWELYYPPFEAAVQAGAGAVACAMVKVNGSMACENPDLLKRDLKGTMGFKGFVMSEEMPSGPSALRHGLDLILPGTAAEKVKALQLAVVDTDMQKEAAMHVLTSMYRGRLDEFPKFLPNYGPLAQGYDTRSQESTSLAQQAATSAVTLLKNDGTLPLDPARIKRVAVLGQAASAPPKVGFWNADYYSGGGSAHVQCSNGHDATALAQIVRRAASVGVEVASTSNSSNLTAARETASQADIVIVVAATTSTEGLDRTSLALDDNVDALIADMALLKPTVVLMQTPGAVLTPWRDGVAAIANLFLAGEATGSAWAAVLFGDVSPAGKLPLVMPKSEDDAIRPEIGNLARYTEGLHTSYRSNGLGAAFPFGHGLSYTEFTYGQPQTAEQGCLAKVCLMLDVINSGNRPGAEVVQAYLRFASSEGMPQSVLRSFQKTAILQPGEKEEVFLMFTTRDLSTYHSSAGWIEQSHVQVDIGSSSSDIRQTTFVNVPVSMDGI